MANNINMTKADGAQSDDIADVDNIPAIPKTYAPFAKPELIELEKLFARDNSGGPEYKPDTANFGDGGNKKGQGIGDI